MAILRRRRRLADPERAALARLLAAPTFEIIPLRNVDEQSAHLPPGATVSVTASPAKGIEATVALAVRMEGRGFRAIPHLSARMIRDRAQLRVLLTELADAGIDRAFVVGGDSREPGDFPDGLSLLREMAELGIVPREIGIPGYPQGHAFIPDDRLLEVLAAKVPFATSISTQLCFDPKAIASWLAARRADGLTLPVKIGIPGVSEIPKLMTISARIGVRDSSRFIMKNTRFIGQLLASGGLYRPAGLLEDIAPTFVDPTAGIEGLHLYTFNQVEPTERWRGPYLASLDAASVE